MNERMQELVRQAGVHYEVMPKNTVYEKFAEALIKEGAAELARSDRYRGRAFAEDLMLHFGIVPARHDWVIKKVEGSKDKFYVEHGEPPLHVLRTYGIV